MDDTDTKAPSPSPSRVGFESPKSSKSASAKSRKELEDIFIEVRPSGPAPYPAPTDDTEINVELRQKGSTSGGRLRADKVIELDRAKGPFRIKFQLKDWLNWRDGDPFWIIKDCCPTKEEIDHQQIWLDKKPTNKTITIIDMNVGDRCELHYRLNFDGNVFCDPIIENGGGNFL